MGNELDKVIEDHSLHRPPLSWDDTCMFCFVEAEAEAEAELNRGKFFTCWAQLHHHRLTWVLFPHHYCLSPLVSLFSLLARALSSFGI